MMGHSQDPREDRTPPAITLGFLDAEHVAVTSESRTLDLGIKAQPLE
jgi:hypothetical protein